MTDSPKLKAFRDNLERNGVSVAALARQHACKPSDIYTLLCGRNKGKRGRSHRVAVAIGLKDGVI